MTPTAMPMGAAPSAPASAPSAAPAASPAPSAAPVSAPDSVPSGNIETYSEPVHSLAVENEIGALLDGDAPPSVDEIDNEQIDIDIPEEVTPAAPAVAKPADAPADQPADDDAVVDPPPADAPKPDAAAAAAGVPEGVKVLKVNGKPSWVMDPEAGRSAFARAALVDEAATILGEPLTKEGLQYRQNVVEGFEGMRSDLLSDNPADQAHVIDHFADVIQQAQARGEIGHDALSGMVKVTLDRSIAEDTPVARAVLSHITQNPKVLSQVVSNIYEMALTEEDATIAQHLWNSAQQVQKRISGDFRPVKEFEYLRASGAKTLPTYDRAAAKPAGVAPVAAPAAAAAPAANPAFGQWTKDANQGIAATAVQAPINDLVKSVVSDAQAQKFPSNLKSLKDQLTKAVDEGIAADKTLRSQTEILVKRARLATSPEIRDQLKQEVVQRHAVRAKQILAQVKGPILTEFAQLLNAASTTEAARVSAGQRAGRQAPPAGGPSAARSGSVPPKTGKFDNAGDFQNELNSTLDAA